MKKKTTPIIQSVGIDVSKNKLDVAILHIDKTNTVEVFTNDPGGITKLIAFLKQQGTTEAVPVVFESTGNCHFLLAVMLSKTGFLVNRINPLITKKFQRSSIRNAKTDTIDAIRLAQIGATEPDLKPYNATKEQLCTTKIIASLAKLEKVRQRLSAHKKQLKEVDSLMDFSIDFSEYEIAVDAIDRQIAMLRKLLTDRAPEEAEELALNVPGLSWNQSSVLLTSLMDKSFTSRDQLVAFVGLDLMARSSGTWSGKVKLSKRGNPYLRKVLFQIAWGLSRHNDRFKEYYEKLREDGKHYFTCMMAIARKFLRFLFAYYWQKSISFPQV